MTDVQDRDDPTPSQQLSRVDTPMERKRIGDMTITKWAGLTFNEYREAIEFAKLMSQARNSVPEYLKGNPGDCLAIVTQSLRWRLEPYWVAQHSYVARKESLIAYDSAVHSAIILSSGMLRGRPRYSYDGEGETRTCKVVAYFVGEEHPHDYTTPPLAKCRPRRNDEGVVKGSPLWDKDPDQQLAYFAMRSWGRRHAQELLGGVYDRDEFDDTTQDTIEAKPTSPNLMDRLPAKLEGTKGFQENIVDVGLAKRAEKVVTEQLRQSAAVEDAKAQEAKGKATGEATADGGSEVAAQAETTASEPATSGTLAWVSPTHPRPTTSEQYMAYAAKWIEVGNDPDNLEARWDGEQDIRADLKVGIAVRKRLEGMLRARINELRKPKRK